MHLRSRRQVKLRGVGGLLAAATLFVFAGFTAYAQLAADQQSAQSHVQGNQPQWPRIGRDVAFDSKTTVPTVAELHVLEDGVEQPEVALRKDDEPVSICLMLDVSTSMRENASAVVDASQRIIASVEPQDEIELISYSLPTFIEQDFTTDRGQVAAALGSLKFQGASAFYDALSASIEELKKRPFHKFRPIIVILSDGDDNYSHTSLQVLSRKMMSPNTTMIYSIWPPGSSEKGRDALALLAKSTGGTALEPAKISLLSKSAEAIARDIHSRYRLEYTSTHTQMDGKLHKIEVRFQPAGASKSKVVYRQEYYAPLQ
jgi:VWFA-related protein